MSDRGEGTWWSRQGDDIHIYVRVSPRASVTRIVGIKDGALHVKVNAPPVEGAANRAITRLLADALSIAPSSVALVRGERARVKTFVIRGVANPGAFLGELPFPA
ncbi:MAG: DUF167 domain-containing protein [Acidimicrobiia bacterium]